MPHPIIARRLVYPTASRLTLSVAAAQYLHQLAIADGASVVYDFSNTSFGIFPNLVQPGHWDLVGPSGFTVATTGVVNPDLLSVTFNTTTGGAAPYFRHIEGTRPPMSGAAVTWEFVVRFYANNANTYAMEGRRNSGLTAFSILNNGDNTATFNMLLPNGTNNGQTIASNAAEKIILAHYVVRWNGTTYSGYRNNVEKFSVDPASTGNLGDGAPFGLAVGGLWDLANNNSASVIDFLALYRNVHLSDSQIASHYDAFLL